MQKEIEVRQIYLDEHRVFFSSTKMPQGKGRTARHERDLCCVKALLKKISPDLRALDSSQGSVFNGVKLVRGLMGRPLLEFSGRLGVSVSFSHAMAHTWVAVCPTGGIVGIDAANSGEFSGNYPFHKAFHDEELNRAEALTAGDRPEAASLVWSAKEAAVKALGCGFNLLEPLEVLLIPRRSTDRLVGNDVDFSPGAKARLKDLADAKIRVASFREPYVWVSIAIGTGSNELGH